MENNYVKDFPLIKEGLHYLDTGATSIKPQVVIDAMDDYYKNYGVNIHRGVYGLSYKATDVYENSREIIANFINADFKEVVFTRGASSSLNLIALSYGMANINEGDEVIVSELEHHSSVLPWLNVCKTKKAKLVYVELNEEGRITVDNFKKALSDKTKFVQLTHVSNVMGYVTPIEEIIKICHERNVIVSVDAAQSVPHMKIDVKKMDCDFLSFSGHKMLGPTGIGILYGKSKLLKEMNPIELGGDMNDEVCLYDVTYKDIPYKFETGTMPIAEVIGLTKAIEYLNNVGFENIHKIEKELHEYALSKLENISGITVYNKTAETAIITFNIDDVHPHDAASVFDKNNVCLRAGHHCAQLITKWLGVIATLRASFYFYNTKEDVDAFIDSIIEARDFFSQF